MIHPDPPLLWEPEALAAHLDHPQLRVIDLGGAEQYAAGHLPGAVHLDPARLRLGVGPGAGLLPEPAALQGALRGAGIGRGVHVVACDHDLGAEACRLLWVLACVSHTHCSLLNGGFTAWAQAGLPVETAANVAHGVVDDAAPQYNPEVIADRQYVLAALGDESIQILDARSPAEYNGEKSPSKRAGRIPGARNLNWLDSIDPDTKKLRPEAELRDRVAAAGLSRERETIVYCQTHRRSSHSFVMLRSLGFGRVRGYAGSWAEWGNDPALPME